MDEQNTSTPPVTLFYSYAHEDELLRNELEKHLRLLQYKGIITTWHDRCIVPGTDWMHDIDFHLREAAIILLLISPDFLASDYCYNTEMRHALELHKRSAACVIPIILRPVDWNDAPFAHLQCLPKEAKPVTEWSNRDAAFRDVLCGGAVLLIPALLCSIFGTVETIGSGGRLDLSGLANDFIMTLVKILIPCIGGGLVITLVNGLLHGLSAEMLDEHSNLKPNQGIRLSAHHSILVGSSVGIFGGLAFSILSVIVTNLVGVGLIVGPIGGVIFALPFALQNGGLACIQHLILRLLLWRTGSLPWKFPHFLDYAAERIFLRKVGGAIFSFTAYCLNISLHWRYPQMLKKSDYCPCAETLENNIKPRKP